MNFLSKILIIFTIIYVVNASSPISLRKVGKVMTGPPSHGDYVLCWEKNEQVVLSGGLCKSSKYEKGVHGWGYVGNGDVIFLYEKLIDYKPTSVCESFRNQYYLVGVIDGCMVSTSNESTITELIPLINKTWAVIQDDSQSFIPSSSKKDLPSIGIELIPLICILIW